MSAFQDGSESVDDFLARIANLSNQTAAEDAERARRMEADMLQARKERQLRRAERARSLSPSKSGPNLTTTPVRSSTPGLHHGIEPPVTLTPSSQDRSGINVDAKRWQDTPIQRSNRQLPEPPRPNTTLTPETSPIQTVPATSATSLSRSGTLSWQQRSNQRTTSPVRSRPLSMVAAVSPAMTEPKTTEIEAPISRSEIAQSLGAKDPTWFRQTQDRGHKSGAYRRNESESESKEPTPSRGMQLPGMSQTSTSKVLSSSSSPSDYNTSFERQKSPTIDSDALRNRGSPVTHQQNFDAPPNPVHLSKSRTLPPPTKTHEHDPVERVASTSPTRSGSILSSARPPSPTKGLGGFVQSAMMKRSDSVSKRWSVQANSGLKRGDSLAGNRTPVTSPTAGTGSLHSRTMSRDSWNGREPERSATPVSRPQSRQGGTNVGLGLPLSESATSTSKTIGRMSEAGEQPIKFTTRQEKEADEEIEGTLSRSPSKTLDPRRWSPTKSSWLESALAKPEPMKASTLGDETPSWMMDLRKSKVEGSSRSTHPDSKSDATESIQNHEKPALRDEGLLAKHFDKPESAEVPPVKSEDQPDVSPEMPAPPTDKSALSLGEDQAKETPFKPTKPKTMTSPPLSKSSIWEPKVSDTTQSGISSGKTDVKPPAVKPKPQEQVRTDFRANLKARSADTAATRGAEPEFRSMFGKLKKVQTQNYVAPDELKDNINRGKAGLSKTDGPQPSKRVDEFKESLLQQKEAIKLGEVGGAKRGDSRSPERLPEPEPEALIRRKTVLKPVELKASVSSKKPELQPISKPSNLVELTPKQNDNNYNRPTHKSAESNIVSSASPTVTKEPVLARKQAPMTETKKTSPQLSKAVPLAKHEPLATETRPLTKQISPEQDAKSEPSPASKLAARLNPALANILSRGPAARSPNDRSSTDQRSESVQDRKPEAAEDDAGAGELTHMTKGRAKGPKRRAPKVEVQKSSPAPKSGRAGPVMQPVSDKEEADIATPTVNQKADSDMPRSLLPNKSRFEQNPTPIQLPKKSQTFSDRGASSAHDKESNTNEIDMKPVSAGKILPSTSPTTTRDMITNSSESPRPLAAKPFNVASDVRSASPSRDRNIVANPKQAIKADLKGSDKLPLTPSKSRLNMSATSAPTTSDDRPTIPKKTILEVASVASVGPSTPAKPSVMSKSPETPQRQTTQPPSVSSSKPGQFKELPATKSTGFLSTFFQSPPATSEKAEHDTQAFLESQMKAPEKIKTIKKQVWEVTSEGKTLPMPQQQEHILFEESMYLCVHNFENSASLKTTEAYLWQGDAVTDAQADDAQLFCRRTAREHNAKLVIIKQGRESSSFFQALGGIVIIRKSRSSALYMLRGRQHLGHVAFDEVEFSSSSLCSGFPHLVSAKFGKLFLWKGKGSGVDEVGCARLIGMDIGLTGEIEEVDEGRETNSFWESFPSGADASKKDTSTTLLSQEWKSRVEHKGYPCKLFRVSSAQPKATMGFWGLRSSSPPKTTSNKAQVDEIIPFCQGDLESSDIYILDAYRQIYVYVGHTATNKSSEFVTAVHMAQEMAVLAPSIQDRSLLPSCYVVYGEPPSFFQMSFRKWVPGQNIEANKTSGCLPIQDAMSELGMK